MYICIYIGTPKLYKTNIKDSEIRDKLQYIENSIPIPHFSTMGESFRERINNEAPDLNYT